MKCPKCNHEFEIEDKRGEQQKLGMVKKAVKGIPMSRPAFGYKFYKGELIPTENFREV